ncbi:alkaline phosphatase [Histoplasma capsulatum G186AR]|uniref:Alkaline phosphatase n=1 Tax=Ajellomyces capsulatus (strain G186AR / H82 / ATCC MYA-2454 / RMSCC 2432) TaxID=447093 RepID=C0NTR4_AJECG|nr:alkaline phosphatase [Histoplasma capsulatum G186AR]EEH05425.1 alkaline phosphatase [Histoplasma capsulatum G186AR]
MPPLPGYGAFVQPRIICYHQTYHPNNGGKYMSMLPLTVNNTGITHVILAAIHLNDGPGNITLNDHSPEHPRFTSLWTEAGVMRTRGVKVMGMLGGAARGTFERLDQDADIFERYYVPLRDMIRNHPLDGLDLDVEEEMSLRGIIRLIDRLKADFGEQFIITLAPVATALIEGMNHLSGFNYKALEAARGSKIAWYNTQFYNGWGTIENLEVYDRILSEGWSPRKVVVGILTNPANGSRGYVPMNRLSVVLGMLMVKHPTFGGVMGWEYFNALPGDVQQPWQWAALGPQNEIVRHSSSAARHNQVPDTGQFMGERAKSRTCFHLANHCDAMPSIQTTLATTSSILMRLSGYIFLRWIPGHQFPPLIVTSLLVYLTSVFVIVSGPAFKQVQQRDRSIASARKDTRTAKGSLSSGESSERSRNGGERSLLSVLATGLPSTHAPYVNLATVGINILIALGTLDAVTRGQYMYPTTELAFSRVGYVSSTTANILIREPDVKQLPIRISYRVIENGREGESFEGGVIYVINNDTDYTFPITLTGLQPSKEYQYSLSNNMSGKFNTAAAPGSAAAYRLSFLSSSCMKANFPYNPLNHPLRIYGLELISTIVSKLPSFSRPSFMLFLGDFIYIDVPFRWGSSISHYRSEYRKVYASPSWYTGPEPAMNIPWIHTLDDHEIANDWHLGNETDPYPAAFDTYRHYHMSVNPPTDKSPFSVPFNTTYFSFTNGPASFFMLDTRTYRSEPLRDNSTMLGSAQLNSLLHWISREEPTGVQWKIIASSVPFSKNWRIGTEDTWGGFLGERRRIFDAIWRAERELGVRVVLLSGDRHEFGAIRFPDPFLAGTPGQKGSGADSSPEDGMGIHEFCTGPLNMFHVPGGIFSQSDDEDVVIKYLPAGNNKLEGAKSRVLPPGQVVFDKPEGVSVVGKMKCVFGEAQVLVKSLIKSVTGMVKRLVLLLVKKEVVPKG